ncbi:retrotransposon protein, putative, ty1-copia subclass [Tanacetum coccineum]
MRGYELTLTVQGNLIDGKSILGESNGFVTQPEPLAPLPYPVVSQAARDAYDALLDAQNEVACLMLGRRRSLSKLLSFEDEKLLGHNFNMHSMGKTLAELHAMLKLHEKGIPKKAKTPIMLAIREGRIQKDKKKIPQRAKGKGKGKNKLAYDPKPKIPPLPKREHPAKDSICHHCIFTIELYAFPNKTWVYDTGCGTHICNTSLGLRESMKLKYGALTLYMGNGMRVAVEAIRSFDLILPIIMNYGISVSKDNVFYFAIPRDGIYEIDMHNLYPNNEVENQLGKKIKAIQSDRGGEYLSYEFVNHMKSCGIISQLTPPYTPQNNRVFERRNHTLLDMVRSMINLTTVPKSFWGYALETAARNLNMVPTKKVDRTPYEIWHGKSPMLSYLRFYYPQENKIFISQNAEFFENSFMVQEASGSHGLLEMSGSNKGLELIQEEDTQPSKNTSKEHTDIAPTEAESQKIRVPIRRSAGIPQVPDRYGYYVDIEEYELVDLNEPPNYKAALADPESDKWLEAMNTEMQSMKDNQVWYLVNLPSNGQTVGCKRLFKKKTNMDGNVHTFKARLVTKGFTQTYGVDYGETFSPVAKIRAIRILLAIAAFYDYEIWKMDVKTAFLNGHLSEDVYMVQPEGFVDPKHPNKNPDEPCVYLKASGSNVTFLVLYVDDILLMGNSVAMLQEVKSWLCKCFSMKDLGEAAYILGIKIIQWKTPRRGYTPMMEKPDYRKSQGAKTPTKVQRMQRVPYASAIGILKIWFLCMAKPEDELKVSCYNDANFQTDKDDTKSQTGYVFVLNGGAVDWKSAKQSTTAMSSTEAEYITAAEASMKVVWMRKFIDGFGGVIPLNKRPMEMLCDNEPALAIAGDPRILKGAKHF